MRAEVRTVDLNRTAIGLTQSEDALQRGRFAGAVRTQESEDLAWPDFETDAGNRLSHTVAFRQAGHRNRCGRRSTGFVIHVGVSAEQGRPRCVLQPHDSAPWLEPRLRGQSAFGAQDTTDYGTGPRSRMPVRVSGYYSAHPAPQPFDSSGVGVASPLAGEGLSL